MAGLHAEMACAVVARGSAADGSLGIAALTSTDLVDAGDRSLKFAEEGDETGGGSRSWPCPGDTGGIITVDAGLCGLTVWKLAADAGEADAT